MIIEQTDHKCNIYEIPICKISSSRQYYYAHFIDEDEGQDLVGKLRFYLKCQSHNRLFLHDTQHSIIQYNNKKCYT